MSDATRQVKQISMVYTAMAIMQLFVGVVFYVLISTGFTQSPDYTLALTLQKIALFFVPLSMAAGYFIFRVMLKGIDRSLPLELKLKKYLSLVLIRAALFECGYLFCCVAALLTGVQLFLYMAPVVFLVFLLVRPTADGIAIDLELDQSDRNKLAQS